MEGRRAPPRSSTASVASSTSTRTTSTNNSKSVSLESGSRSSTSQRRESVTSSKPSIASRLERWILGEFPPSLTVRTKVRLLLETTLPGHLWNLYQIIITLLACVFFVTSIYETRHTEFTQDWSMEWVFIISVVTDLALRFYTTDNRWKFFCHILHLVDLVSVIPTIVSLIEGHSNTMTKLVFLRSVRAFKLLRLLRAVGLKDQMNSPVEREIMMLGISVVCILFISASLLYIIEGLPFHEGVYFSVVTMATVGYGDVKAISALGQFVVCLLIIVSFGYLPVKINYLTQLMAIRSKYDIIYKPQAETPHVLIVGSMDPNKISIFLGEFFHPDRRSGAGADGLLTYKVVIMDNSEPSDELKDILANPLVAGRAIFLKGTVMDEKDLHRAGTETALACFIFSDGLMADNEEADAQTILRTLMMKTFRPSIPCIVQLHNTHNLPQLHMVKRQRIICYEELKWSIFGLAAMYPGISTILSGILTSSLDNSDSKDPQWVKEYVEGCGMELYPVKLSSFFSGFTFHKVCKEVFYEFKGATVVLGIEERQVRMKHDGNVADPSQKHGTNYVVKRVLANPGKDYTITIRPGMQAWAFVMAKDRPSAERINDMVIGHSPVKRPDPRKMQRSLGTKFHFGGAPPSHKDSEADPPTHRGSLSNDDEALIQRLQESSISSSGSQATKRRRSLIKVLDPQGLSTTTGGDESRDIGITVIKDVASMPKIKDHIIFIMPHAGGNMYHFLRSARAKFLHGTQYNKDIVILSRATPDELEHFCAWLPEPGMEPDDFYEEDLIYNIYVIEGDPTSVVDLRRAGVETAYSCVIMADHTMVQVIDEEKVDDAIIKTFLTIEKIRSHYDSRNRQPLCYIMEVLSVATLKILDQTLKTFKNRQLHRRRKKNAKSFRKKLGRLSFVNRRGPDYLNAATEQSSQVPSEDSYTSMTNYNTSKAKVDFGQRSITLFPIMTSGFSFINDIFDVMSCQLFYNSDILRFVDIILGFEIKAAASLPNARQIESGRLGRIPVPQELTGNSYSDLFEMLMLEYQAVPFALYRYNFSTDSFYVYTMPQPDTVLRPSDYVFFLAPLDVMGTLMKKFPPNRPPLESILVENNVPKELHHLPSRPQPPPPAD